MKNREATGPLRIHRSEVLPEWIDYNGHLNDGYYAVAFTVATDALQDYVGLDAAYREESNCSIYTVEAHLTYLRELRVGTPLQFESYVLGVDEKRLHLFHSMIHADEGFLAATHELMLLHVDQTTGRTAPMPEGIQAKLRTLRDEHAGLEWPEQVGSTIGMRKR